VKALHFYHVVGVNTVNLFKVRLDRFLGEPRCHIRFHDRNWR